MRERAPRVAIVDFGMGNLFSVQQACEWAGLAASITRSRGEIEDADAVVLPGVGAFADAMSALRDLDLVETLRTVAVSATPLVGVCLGMQLLMDESHEFGRHAGLGIIAGEVVWLQAGVEAGRPLKVPQVCWNQLHRADAGGADAWSGTLLDGLPDGASMYFLHSLYVRPSDAGIVIARTHYGAIEFCSALQYRNVFACQAHPERSGPAGLRVYANLARRLGAGRSRKEKKLDVGR